MRADFTRQIKTIRRFFFLLPHCFFAKINLGISTRFLRLENKVVVVLLSACLLSNGSSYGPYFGKIRRYRHTKKIKEKLCVTHFTSCHLASIDSLLLLKATKI